MKFDQSRTFGIEIEFKVPSSLWGASQYGADAYSACRNAIAQPSEMFPAGLDAVIPNGSIHNDLHNNWKLVPDGSVHGGLECVSPIMSGVEARQELRHILKALKSIGCKVDRQCGIHIHHDVGDFNAKQLANIGEIYRNHETVIDMMMAPSRRANEAFYCQSLRHRTGSNDFWQVGTGIDSITTNLPTENRSFKNDFAVRMQGNTERRYFKVNYMAYLRHGTVEFRQHQGSLNPNKIWSWVVFTQMIVSTAKARTRKSVAGRRVNTGNPSTAMWRACLRELKMRRSADSDPITREAVQRLSRRPGMIEAGINMYRSTNHDDAVDEVSVTLADGSVVTPHFVEPMSSLPVVTTPDEPTYNQPLTISTTQDDLPF
jgi:hypothetical protein